MTSTQTPPLDYASPAPAAAPRRINIGALVRTLGPLAGLILVYGLFSALRPSSFPTRENLEIMALQTAVVATAALGMTMIIVSGGIDLSVGAQIAWVTVVIALLIRDYHFSATMAALAGIGFGALCGLVIGLLVAKIRLEPFIVTLGAWSAYRGGAELLASQNPIYPPATWLNNLLSLLHGKQSWMIFPPGVWIMLFMALVVAAMFRYTRFGRQIFAVGSNEATARLCGVPVDRVKILVYVLGAGLAGLAGVLAFSNLTGGDPTTANGLELNIIAAVVIGGASLNGGRGTVLGTLIGAMIMTVVSSGCTQMGWSSSLQKVVTGCIIVLAVAIDRLQSKRSAAGM